MDMCLVYAPIITLVVSLLKRVSFIGRNPKVVAAVLSTVLTIVPVLVKGTDVGTLKAVLDIAGCLVTTLGLSVGAYEIAAPALKALKLDPLYNEHLKAATRNK